MQEGGKTPKKIQRFFGNTCYTKNDREYIELPILSKQNFI